MVNLRPFIFITTLILTITTPTFTTLLPRSALRQESPTCGMKNLDFSGFYRGQQVRTTNSGWNLTTYLGTLVMGQVLSLRDTPAADLLDASAIFNTSDPTKSDEDLGSPNESCGGPGVGSGGVKGSLGENCEELGNVVIAHSNDVKRLREICDLACNNGAMSVEEMEEDDGIIASPLSLECSEVCLPNDYIFGATFVLEFEDMVNMVNMVKVMDAGDPFGVVIQIGDGEAKFIQGYGNNSVTKIDVSDMEYEAGDLLIVKCLGSCALIDVEYEECDGMDTPSPEPEISASPGAEGLLGASASPLPAVLSST